VQGGGTLHILPYYHADNTARLGDAEAICNETYNKAIGTEKQACFLPGKTRPANL
jgi:hypothetical protein